MKIPRNNSVALRRLVYTPAALVALVAAQNARSSVLYFDPNGSTAVAAGTYTWNTTSAQWSTTSSLSGSPVVWNSADAACFCAGSFTGAITVMVNSAINCPGVFDGPFNPPGCTLTIAGTGSLNFPSGTQGIGAGGSDGDPMTINVPITGSAQIETEYSKGLTLGAANTYTGGTLIGGTGGVTFGNSGAFGYGTITWGTGGLIQPSGTSAYNITNAMAHGAYLETFAGNSGGVTFSGPWTLPASGTVTFINISGQITNSGVISGSTGVNFTNRSGAGWVLTGVNTYTGGTTNQGPSTLTIAGSGTLGSGSYAGVISNGGTFIYNSSANQTFSGALAGLGTLIQDGSGTLTLSGGGTIGTAILGQSNNTSGTINMSTGSLFITNSASEYVLMLGGGGAGGGSLTGVSGSGSGAFNLSGGNLTVERGSSAGLQQDGFVLGLGTNSSGTYSQSAGTATILCGIEIGTEGAGTVNVSGGTLIANSWFHIGEGANSTTAPGLGSGTFNLSGGNVYILQNSVGAPSTFNGGLTIGQNVTNAAANISAGALYCYNITFSGEGIANSITNALNMCGGTVYVGPSGVSSNVAGSAVTSMHNLVNISGGTFHTADYATNSGTAASNGNTNNILSDGTNWTWNSNVPVNLTNTSFVVNGVTGPGYVTFAPEPNRTITLNNTWSGTGGFVVNGSGTVIAGANLQGVEGGITVSNGTLAACGTINSLNNFAQPGAYPTNYVMAGATLVLATNLNNTAGTLITSNLTVNGTLSVLMNTPATVGGSNSLLIITNLTLGAGSVLNVNVETTPTANQPYVVAEYWGTLNGTFGTVNNSAGDTMTVNYIPPSGGNPGEITLTVTAFGSGTFNWIANNNSDDFNVYPDWDLQAVPANSACVVQFTNGNACNYSASDNYTIGPTILGPLNNSSGTVNMTGGALTITNSANEYLLMLGGGAAGLSTLTGASATNCSGVFNMSGGNLTLVRASNPNEYQDGLVLGLGTNSSGTFSLSGGTATLLCGIEIGLEGSGTLNVSGGTLIDNGWFHVGEGVNLTTAPGLGSGTFNLSGGTVYILANNTEGTQAQNAGLTVNQGVTNATVNISGGTLYCYVFGMNGQSPNNATDTLNISGGTLYIGAGGVVSNETVAGSALTELLNISGGTFHTLDMTNVTAASNGNTNSILHDGTNWTWSAYLPVNLTNSSFAVNSITGPGYVTFAPESTRTITLSNVWSGVGGMNCAGPGNVILLGANNYTGNTTISGGTLALGSSGSINNSATISIAAGATFDVSAIASYSLSASTTLSASGRGTGSSAATINGAAGGTVNLNSQPLLLNYNPSTFNGDGSDPSLYVSQGTLVLNGNSFTVNNASATPLGVGTYVLVVQNSGNITASGAFPVTVTGSGLAAGDSASISVNGATVNLIVTPAASFSGLPASAAITYGAPSLTLSGVVSGSGPTYPAMGETVYVTINGLTQPATISDSTGDFSLNYTTATLPSSAAPYSITYAYTGDASLGGATNSVTTVTVNPAALAVTANNQSKTYGQTLAFGAGSTQFTTSGLQNGETIGSVTLAPSGNAGAPTAPVSGSPYTLTPSAATGGTFNPNNYLITYYSGTLSITPAGLTITALNTNRFYGLTNPVFQAAYSGFVNGEVLGTSDLGGLPALTTSADTNSPVGEYVITNAVGTLTSTNYSFTFVNGLLTVTNEPLVFTAGSAIETYGAADTNLTYSVSGLVNGENLTNAVAGAPELSSTDSANSPVAGSPYPITITAGTLELVDTNYVLVFSNGAVTVTPASVTGSITADNKTYDGTTTAAISGYSLSGVLFGDDVSLTGGTATFSDKNAGLNKTVTATGLSLAGSAVSNYELAFSTAATTANIEPASLTVAAAGLDKVYDGTTVATVTLSDNRIAGDNLTDAYAAANFSDRNVGVGKSVAVTGISVSGPDAGNYTYNTTAMTTASIAALPITVTATANTKTYDGTTTAAAVPSVTSGTIATGDTAAFTESYDTPAPGTGKTLTPAGAVLDGNNGNNYTLTFVSSANGVINQATLTVTANSTNRVYGATNPVFSVSYSGFVNGETLATSDVTGSPTLSTSADTNSPVGEYAITGAAGTLTSTDYSFIFVNGLLTVTNEPLVFTADNAIETYGTADTSLTYSVSGLVNGENLTNAVTGAPELSSTDSANSPVAGSPYSITITAGTLELVDTNYVLVFSNGAVTVTPASVTGSITADNKTYDGTTTAAISSYSLSGVLFGDDVSLTGGTATFSDKNAGLNKTVTATGLSLAGSAVSNYQLASSTAMTSADIDPASLTVAAAGSNKAYDGTTVATVTLSDNRTAGDNLTDAYTAANFSDRNVGVGKSVAVTGISVSGPDAGNYTYNTTAMTTASIAALPITVTATANTKTYDGTTSAAAVPSVTSGTIATGDTAAFTETYDTPAPGTGKTLTPAGAVLDGNNGNNYTLTFVSSASGVINQATLTVTANSTNRVYGATNPVFSVSYSGFVNGETLATSDVTGSPALSTSADTNSPVGQYVITNLAGTLSSSDYSFSLVNGTLIISNAFSTNMVTSSSNPALPGTSVTFTATVSALSPSQAVPYGMVQFLAGGNPLGAPVVLSNGQATVSSSSLPHGYNSIEAVFSGSTNADGSTNIAASSSATLNELINSPPVAGDAVLQRQANLALTIPITGLLAYATDPDGDSLTLVAVDSQSTNDATIVSNATSLVYEQAAMNPNVADTFHYTVSDPFGATSTGLVEISILPNPTPVNIASATFLGNGALQLNFTGVPNYTYLIQVTTNLIPPITWTTISTNTAANDGTFNYTDSSAVNYSNRFYRTATP